MAHVFRHGANKARLTRQPTIRRFPRWHFRGPPQHEHGASRQPLGVQGEATKEESQLEAFGGCLEDGAQCDAPVLGDEPAPMRTDVEAKLVSDGVPMARGYGPSGTSVQVVKQGQGTAWKSDREIVQYTAMRGKEEVKCALIGEKVRRVALSQEVWEEVMNAGLSQHPVGRLVEVGKKTSRVVWDTPPSPEWRWDAMVACHNHLVDLCGISGRVMRKLSTKTGQSCP